MENRRTYFPKNQVSQNTLKNAAFYFFLGGTLYSLIELAWRGYTHWTMTLLGGFVTVILKVINQVFPTAPMFFKATIGSATITFLELIVGLIVNRKHNLDVWSYDAVPYNILGQICPIYTVYWFLLCIAAFLLFRFIDITAKPKEK